MRRQDRLISETDAKRMLEESKVGRIGVETDQGPYIVPVLYLYSPEENSIYIHSSTKGKKIEALIRNPRVCFETDELRRIVVGEGICSCTAEYRSVIVFGQACIVAGTEKTEILHRLSRKYGEENNPNTPIEPEMLERTAVVKITVDQITGKTNPQIRTVP
ncbi:pyridoxamine 5'-phosphate oxidase family protein [Candidatus Bathyarchaeota archaeon]|nr:pyridoxamine 5'-phosphate oxidase family protein [Candidatus Bathyarchaeota archaeon]